MKLRLGFVSNSSSSSFVVRNLTHREAHLLKNIGEFIEKVKPEDWTYNDWTIEELPKGEGLRFYTTMDNFNMVRLIESLGLKIEDIGDYW